MKQYILNGGNPGEARAVLNEARVNELYFLGLLYREEWLIIPIESMRKSPLNGTKHDNYYKNGPLN